MLNFILFYKFYRFININLQQLSKFIQNSLFKLFVGLLEDNKYPFKYGTFK